MALKDEDPFLEELYNRIRDQIYLVKTQQMRLKKLLIENWNISSSQFPTIEYIIVEKDIFWNNIEYRIECLQHYVFLMETIHNQIKNLISMIYSGYISTPLIHNCYFLHHEAT